MKFIFTLFIFLYTGIFVHAQDFSTFPKKTRDSIEKKEEALNISENFYGDFIKYPRFRRFDITFEDRLSFLDNILSPAHYKILLGIGFEPYQGTKLHVGADYELLPTTLKSNIYVGAQYLIGLAQSTVMENNSTIDVGFHNYLMPFIGFQYWPWKINESAAGAKKKNEYLNPGFSQLFFLKLQAGYSFLVSNLQVTTKGAFDNNLLEQIKHSTGNTFVLKLALGINIPSQGKSKRKYDQIQSTLKGINFY
jgi:hypothetical protein